MPPTEASPETAKVPPIVVLLETFKEFPLKLEVPPVMAESIAEVYAIVRPCETDDILLPMDVPIESA